MPVEPIVIRIEQEVIQVEKPNTHTANASADTRIKQLNSCFSVLNAIVAYGNQHYCKDH